MTDESAPTASVQLPEAPSELEKARMRLLRAAFHQASALLQKNASVLGRFAQIDELSHRRSEGHFDFALVEDAERQAIKELEGAALAFADAINATRA